MKSLKIVVFGFITTTVNSFRETVNNGRFVHRIFALLFDLNDVRVVCHVANIGPNGAKIKRVCASQSTGSGQSH